MENVLLFPNCMFVSSSMHGTGSFRMHVFYLFVVLGGLNVVCTMWFCYSYFLLYTKNPFHGVCQQGLLSTHTSQHLHWHYLQYLPCQCRLCLSSVTYQFALFFCINVYVSYIHTVHFLVTQISAIVCHLFLSCVCHALPFFSGSC